MTKERILQIATSHQKQMGSVHPHAIIGTIVDAINEALTEQEKPAKESEPSKEKYGWHTQCGHDDEPSGWLIDGGEEAYNKAMEKWEKSQSKPAKEVGFNKLRDEFFAECTDYSFATKYTPSIKRVSLSPHDLFEWFKNKIQ